MARTVFINSDSSIAHISTQKPSLKEMQDFVGGWIEPVHGGIQYEGVVVTMIVNENGLTEQLALNETGTKMYREMAERNGHAPNDERNRIVGPIIILEGFEV